MPLKNSLGQLFDDVWPQPFPNPKSGRHVSGLLGLLHDAPSDFLSLLVPTSTKSYLVKHIQELETPGADTIYIYIPTMVLLSLTLFLGASLSIASEKQTPEEEYPEKLRRVVDLLTVPVWQHANAHLVECT